jgi:hypothetical protein
MNRVMILLALNLAGVSWARPKTDVLVMTNGDRITCEIKKMESGVLYAGLDYVDGTISIGWSKVARVESTQLFVVQTQSGAVYEGALRTARTAAEEPVRIEILEEQRAPDVVEPRQIVEVTQTSDSFWRRVSGYVDSGLMYTKGNRTTQYNIGSEVRIRLGETWRAQADFNSTLSKSSGSASTRNQLNLKGQKLIGHHRWFGASFIEFLQSSQQGISLQTSLGGGYGRFLKDSNFARISLAGGLAWQNTRYDVSVNAPGTQDMLAGLIAGHVQLFRFKKTALDVSAMVLPAITQPGRVRFNTNASYSIEIISNLWWKLSFYGNWDNRPPPNFSGSDYGTSAGITYSFN